MPRASEIPEHLLARPFTLGEATAAGVTRRVLAGRRFVRMFPAVHAVRGVAEQPWACLAAARLALPDTAIGSHRTAATALGLPVQHGAEPQFWVPASCSGRSVRGVSLHRYHVRPDTVVVAGGVVTSPARTFVDLAAELGLRDLVAVGDAVVRRHGVSPEVLRELAEQPARRHIRAARAAVALVRAGVDSRPETHLRLEIVWGGLPEPDVGRDVFDADGGWLARPDLSYPALRIAIEYDGIHHLQDKRQWAQDILREENLEREGWIVIVITADHLYRRPQQTVSRIREALRRGESR